MILESINRKGKIQTQRPFEGLTYNSLTYNSLLMDASSLFLFHEIKLHSTDVSLEQTSLQN